MEYTFEEWIAIVRQMLEEVMEDDSSLDEEYWKVSYYELHIKPDRAVIYETSFI